MGLLDWLLLGGSLVFITLYGIWRGRGNRDLEGYLLADRTLPWTNIAFAIMATQASAITFLSTPGQASVDGMRFVQFYFGLPLAMVVLCVTAVPIYRRLKVFTAYEYLETRFDAKTRTLAAFLFLIQRGLAAGLTIYAPAIILSVLLGWNLHMTSLMLGGLVVIYTTTGGTRAVNHTQYQQLLLMMGGLAMAIVLVVLALPSGVSLGDALHVAGSLGRTQAIDTSVDPQNRYTLWSGLIGGFFLALSYFGTDQSQVGRYLGGQSVAQTRFGLLFNGLAKIPMQFLILFVGVMVFVFFQFNAPPVFFNPVEVQKVRSGPHAAEFVAIEAEHARAFDVRREQARALVKARHAGDAAGENRARTELAAAQAEFSATRGRAVDLIRRTDPKAQASDTNYIFLSFVLQQFPVGLIGIMLAAIIAASMSSTSAELNALASTTVVDVWKRWFARGAVPNPKHEVAVGWIATAFWGLFAVGFAEFANRLGSLIEAVNILGSLFYGTILGIFLTGFYVKRVGGTPVFVAALIAEVAVIACFKLTKVSFLWYNVIGCLLVVGIALALSVVWPSRRGEDRGVAIAAGND